MSPPLPRLVLPASLVDPDWLGRERLAKAAASPGWTALARRARTVGERGPEPRPPSDPGHLRWLAEQLGLPADCALAACSVPTDGAPDAAWRIDPVHLHVGRDHLVLTDPAQLRLEPAEADALAAAIAPLLAEDALALAAPVAGPWSLRETDPGRPLRLRTRPLAGAVGRNIDAWMPVGDDARRWRRLLNEVQMTWFTHPVNAERAARGLPAVNSLWIEGRAPAPSRMSNAARTAAARLADSPDTAVSVDPGDGATLALDPALLAAQIEGDPLRWLDAWSAMDASVFGPMARAVGPWRDGARLVLAGDAGWRTLEVARRADWRFWRRPDPAAFLAEPADGPGDAPDAPTGPGPRTAR
jgi:hypothetical protein